MEQGNVFIEVQPKRETSVVESAVTALRKVERDVQTLVDLMKQQVKLKNSIQQPKNLITKKSVMQTIKKKQRTVFTTLIIVLTLFSSGGLTKVFNGTNYSWLGWIIVIVLDLIAIVSLYKKGTSKDDAPKPYLAYGLVGILSLSLLGSNFKAVLIIAAIAAGVFLLMKASNNKTAKENAVIESNNQVIIQKYSQISQEIKDRQQDLIRNYGGWFPPDYYRLDAIHFFINAFMNHRANSLSEAINLFEVSEHQRRMEASQAELIQGQRQMKDQLVSGQQAMMAQLEHANALSAESIRMQARTQEEIRRASRDIQDTMASSAAGTQAAVRQAGKDIRAGEEARAKATERLSDSVDNIFY